MTRPFPTAALAVALALAAPASAKDLGVRGATWPVAEPDLLAQIEARLVEMERSGEMARLQRQARDRARMKLEEPDPVPGIAPAREERSRLFDPAITVARDIRTPDGALIAVAGTRVNPLERIALTPDLLFVDGRREAEVAWALVREEESGRPAKIVLLAGRPLDLMRRHRRPFFFDMDGRLAARFGLSLTPVLVAQDGTTLRITEFPVEDRSAPDTDPGTSPQQED
ncbi:MAG: type-F conjugative transfer system protein TraW [Rhodospirillaceae bacterium]|nr:type-F conjugative transfer system protein TraW [Rhodospirillaceae bacterium]